MSFKLCLNDGLENAYKNAKFKDFKSLEKNSIKNLNKTLFSLKIYILKNLLSRNWRSFQKVVENFPSIFQKKIWKTPNLNVLSPCKNFFKIVFKNPRKKLLDVLWTRNVKISLKILEIVVNTSLKLSSKSRKKLKEKFESWKVLLKMPLKKL